MTIELKIEQSCVHLVVDEVCTIESDLKSLRTLRPISNSQVELKINGFLISDVMSITNGFRLIRDPYAVDNSRLIEFRSLRRSTDDILEVTYYTRPSECRRCHGLRIEQDYRYSDIDGSLITVNKESKLVQDLRKIILTSIGSNIFHLWYGTSIPDLIGSKISSASFVRAKIDSDIRTAIRRYVDTQDKQRRALLNVPKSSMDAGERFGQLLKLDVQQDQAEPTAFNVQIAFTSRSNEMLTIDTTLSVPDPQALATNATT